MKSKIKDRILYPLGFYISYFIISLPSEGQDLTDLIKIENIGDTKIREYIRLYLSISSQIGKYEIYSFGSYLFSFLLNGRYSQY